MKLEKSYYHKKRTFLGNCHERNFYKFSRHMWNSILDFCFGVFTEHKKVSSNEIGSFQPLNYGIKQVNNYQ